MRPRLLKKIFRRGELALGVSVGVMATRFAVDILAKRTEKELQRQQQLGAVNPALQRRLKVFRTARSILHVL